MGTITPGAAADHCHSTDKSIPSGSQTRRSPSSTSRSTSSGRKVDEAGGEVGDQRLELEEAPEVLGGSAAMHASADT